MAVTFLNDEVTFYYTTSITRNNNEQLSLVASRTVTPAARFFDQIPNPNSYIATHPSGSPNIFGNIDEVRMWDRALTQVEINQFRNQIVPHTAPGLLLQLSFDEDGTNLPNILNSVIDSPINATLIDAHFDVQNGFTSPQAQIYAPPGSPGYARLTERSISVPIGEQVSFSAGRIVPTFGETNLPDAELLPVTNPVGGVFDQTFNAATQQYDFVYSATNAPGAPDICAGNTVNTLQVDLQLVGTSTIVDSFTFRLNATVFPTFDEILYPRINSLDFTGVPTTGGTIQILGSGFGPQPQDLVGDDGIFLTTPEGSVVRCINATVSLTEATCFVPPGVGGNIPLTLSVCGGSGTSTIRYGTPTVTQITIRDEILIINGANFGPPNEFFGGPGNNITFGDTGIPCSIETLNHTELSCTIPDTVDPSSDAFLDTNITIFVGGQMAVGALRIGGDGSIRDTETPLIIGLVVGFGGCCCILLCAIGILGFAYQKKKGGQIAVAEAPFTPVEKKDFSTVIFGSENAPAPKKNSEHSKLLELLINDPEMKLALEIGELTQITEADSISKAMVIVFESSNKTLDMLKYYIEQEVLNVENPATLFRANSMVSKMFKFYSRLIGLPYLYKTIGKTITQLNFENLGIEVDPEKMEEGEDLNEMRWTLLAQSQKILKHILNSSSDCPTQFRYLCWQLKESVSERYDDHIDKTIGGFIFLRFFCPAVTSPEIYGILDDAPSSSTRRLLILITKSLQNLANDVEFGSKEPYMSNMNDFINENRGKLHDFYEKIILKPSENPGEPAKFPKGVPEKSLQELAEHLSNNLDKIKNQELRRELTDLLQK
eukprot:TRINITY_DN30683_c0_g1_i1.p1 TRINITY_DN30683_c0_g1~~TRINITY_DN30683_c0_g1_i1.p1  ORF type:complete len:882 (-),score=130.54 TRINITY_DN30683_c0_g1_i1:64-2553(-)